MSNKLVILLLALCMLLPACKPNSNAEKSKINTVKLDLSSSDDLSATIDNNTELQLENIDLSKGLIVIEGDFAASSSSRGLESNDNFFKRQDGTIIPVPDEDKKTIFYGSDLNVSGSTSIKIKRLPLDDDFEITSDEYENNTKSVASEEFYYVDLNDQKWKDLDPKQVVITTYPQDGNNSVSLIRRGYKSRSVLGVLDFSRERGFGLDFTAVFVNDKAKVCVLSPKKMEMNTNYTIDSDVAVYKISSNNGSYKITLNKECDIQTRYFDGSFLENAPVPFYNENSVEYEIVNPLNDFIVTIYGGNGSTVKLEKSSRTNVYSCTLSESKDTVFTASDTSAKQTFAAKNYTEWFGYLNLKDSSSVTIYETSWDRESYSVNTINKSSYIRFKKNTNYVFVVNASNVTKDEELISIEESPTDNSAFNIESGEYWSKEIDDKYGRFGLKAGWNIMNSKRVLMNVGSNGTFGDYANPENNITIQIKKVYPNENKFIADVIVDCKGASYTGTWTNLNYDNSRTKYTDVEFKKECVTHYWKEYYNNLVICNECGEIRDSMYYVAEANKTYHFNANSDFLVWVIGTDQVFWKENTPTTPNALAVRFIASKPGRFIKAFVNDTEVNVIEW